MRAVLSTCSLLLLLGSLAWAQQATELLELLRPSRTTDTARINASDRSWEDWVRRTGEQPPDFDEMPSQPFLPDPLAGIQSKAEWRQKREQIREGYEKWVFGRMPPAPGNLRAVTTSERKEGDVTVRDVRLEFGPEHRGSLRVQVLIPPGKGPFPVFLTNHLRTRPWVVPAVRRGYIGCIYHATDPGYGSPDDSNAFIELYPEYDFSALARWAWASMRAVDYLYTLPLVDRSRIGITGHSRNGKQALLAAAFDERISAVVASSGNTGEVDPWRFTTDPFANETIEQITGGFPGWFHPRLRFFAGREHKLPVDQNLLMAMVAPRGLLMASAYSEHQGNSFGFEQAYRSVRRVYQFLDADSRLGLSLRAGEHATTAEDIERYVDFFDSVFGRSSEPPPRELIHDYTWEQWQHLSKEKTAPRVDAGASVQERMRALLGEAPPKVPFPARADLRSRVMTNEGWLGVLFERPIRAKGVTAHPLAFGDDLKGDLYLPASAQTGQRLPAVVWLHSYAYPTGYSRYARPTIELLTAKGFAVLAFDQIGFGTRIHQAKRFYERYPRWSLLGKMVDDTSAAVDALRALDMIQPDRIYLAGWSLGGKVALWTAALNPDVAGVAVSGAFTPLREPAPETEGLHHYSHLHGLLPRLGFYLGREREVPVDYSEILAAIAPRPVLVRAPALDRYANAKAVSAALEEASKAWQSLDSRLVVLRPRDFARFGEAAQAEVFGVLQQWAGK
jgi:pimeloyl-ACP methyl ester carboxylesterase